MFTTSNFTTLRRRYRNVYVIIIIIILTIGVDLTNHSLHVRELNLNPKWGHCLCHFIHRYLSVSVFIKQRESLAQPCISKATPAIQWLMVWRATVQSADFSWLWITDWAALHLCKPGKGTHDRQQPKFFCSKSHHYALFFSFISALIIDVCNCSHKRFTFILLWRHAKLLKLETSQHLRMTVWFVSIIAINYLERLVSKTGH